MSETLPKSWHIGPLHEIVNSVKTGVPVFKGEKEYYSTGSIQGKKFIPEGDFSFEKKPSRANRIAIKNDVFQARMKETDKGLIADDKLSEQLFSTGFLQLRPYGETYSSKLLYYYIISPSFLNQKDDLATGSTQEALTDNNAVNLTFPLPPLNEQKRIVVRLDKIMPRIDAVKERLDKVPAIVKRFRQSVLTAAVTGKLTEKWRVEYPDVGSAEVLCPKNKRIISHEVYRNMWNDFEIPENWTCIHLKEIADLRLGKMLDGNKNTGKETKYIRNVNVRWFQFELDDLKTIKVQAEEIQKLSIKNGDVFICEGGEPGRAAVWHLGENKMTFQKALHRVRFNGKVVPDWLVYNLKVDADTDRLSELFTGSTIKHFTGRSLAEYPVPLPPLEEQKEIVRQVDKLFALADRLETHYQKAKSRVDKLSQSVLAKAFRGELVITEAELAEKEGLDFESAENLLVRILEEKAKFVGSRKSAGGRKKMKKTETGRNRK